jgi:hypothetical protein
MAVSGAPSSVAVADLNGDGKPDLVIANAEENRREDVERIRERDGLERGEDRRRPLNGFV